MMNRRRRGITLMELIFVVVILAVLLAVSLPKLTGSGERSALTTSGRDIARMASLARQNAVSMRKETRLIFSMEEKVWRLELPQEEETRRYSNRTPRTSTWENTNPLHSRVHFAEFLRDGETVRANELVVRFMPNGSSTGATIVLANNRNRRLTVDIERATGRATAYNGEPMGFADFVTLAGGDPTKFAGVEASKLSGTAIDGEGPRFYEIGRSSEERVSAYSDAAARIMGRVVRENQRQQEQSGGPERKIPVAGEITR